MRSSKQMKLAVLAILAVQIAAPLSATGAFAGEDQKCQDAKVDATYYRSFGKVAGVAGVTFGGLMALFTYMAEGEQNRKITSGYYAGAGIALGGLLGDGALRLKARSLEKKYCTEQVASVSDLVNAKRPTPGSWLEKSSADAVEKLVAADLR